MDCIKILCLSAGSAEQLSRVQGEAAQENARLDVRAVSSLEAAFAEAAASPCHAVLVDLDREQALEEIRGVRAALESIPVLAYLSSADSQRGSAALQAGAHECLVLDQLDASGLVWAIQLASARSAIEASEGPRSTTRHPEIDRERLLDILDALPAYVFLQARDYSIPFWNRRFRDVFGNPTGRPCYEVFYGRTDACDPCLTQRVFETREPMASGLTRADGRTYAVSDSLIERAGDDVVVEVGIDVTERERLARERNELASQLRQSHRLESIGTLASGMAHEINNPLMAMMNYAELIAERVEDGPVADYAHSIQSAGKRVADTIRNLLTFTRVEQEPYDTVHLMEPVSGAVSLMGEAFRRDRIEVQVDVPQELPALRCRGRQIEQVLVNLLSNARDALNARFPVSHEEKRVLVKAFPLWQTGDGWQRLTVEDRGVGITTDDLDRVWDPFYTTKPRGEGTGLGLSISHGIITDHGGRMTIESEPGAYTRIHIDLPPEAGLDEV